MGRMDKSIPTARKIASKCDLERRAVDWARRLTQQTIIPVVPTKAPQLSKTTYETILNYFLLNDKPVSHGRKRTRQMKWS